MTTGMLIRPTRIDNRAIDYNSTLNCNEYERISEEESLINETEDIENDPAFFYEETDSNINDLYQIPFSSASGRLANRKGAEYRFDPKIEANIWGSTKLRKLLEEPIGSPISLTREEAREIVLLAAGRRPDLPDGKVYVRETREVLGHAMMKRVAKAR